MDLTKYNLVFHHTPRFDRDQISKDELQAAIMTLAYLHETFGEEIDDAEEGISTYSLTHSIPRQKVTKAQRNFAETFLLYAQPIPSSNLGFIDPKASSVDVDVAGKTFTVHQSPGVLASDRAGGTTGAGTFDLVSSLSSPRPNLPNCFLSPRHSPPNHPFFQVYLEFKNVSNTKTTVLWKITPPFANWLSSPTNFLFSSSNPLLSHTSTVLELGCGISPLNALATSPRISRHILTDQHYVQKLIKTNISENTPKLRTNNNNSSSSRTKNKKQQQQQNLPAGGNKTNISFTPLDWETDTPTAALIPNDDSDDTAGRTKSFDAVLACDCVYNYALVPPLVSTCAAACKLREDEIDEEGKARKQTLCIVAQQLRNDDVFCSWLREFMTLFRVWRVNEDLLPDELRPEAGFVVHVGVLRDSN